MIEHASILATQLPISADDLPAHLVNSAKTAAVSTTDPNLSLREIEMQTIYATLDRFNGNKTATAQQLGVSLKTLYNKLAADSNRKVA